LGVRAQLPIEGVGLILGNDIAGGKVFPQPIVVDKPEVVGFCEQVDNNYWLSAKYRCNPTLNAQAKWILISHQYLYNIFIG